MRMPQKFCNNYGHLHTTPASVRQTDRRKQRNDRVGVMYK